MSEYEKTVAEHDGAAAFASWVDGMTGHKVINDGSGGDTDPRLIIVRDRDGGYTERNLTDHFDKTRLDPIKKAGAVSLHDLASLVAWTKDHKDDGTIIFADENNGKITTIIDYHKAGPDADGLPRFGGFRAVYSLPFSPEWQAWSTAEHTGMDQRDFAEFLEDRIVDVIPAPEDMDPALREIIDGMQAKATGPSGIMQLSKGLQINVDQKATVKHDRSSGQGAITFEEEHRDAGGQVLKVPDLFFIRAPIYLNGDPTIIPVRLRYRMKSGALVWSLNIWRKPAILKQAFDGVVDRISQESGVKALRGTAPDRAPVR